VVQFRRQMLIVRRGVEGIAFRRRVTGAAIDEATCFPSTERCRPGHGLLQAGPQFVFVEARIERRSSGVEGRRALARAREAPGAQGAAKPPCRAHLGRRTTFVFVVGRWPQDYCRGRQQIRYPTFRRRSRFRAQERAGRRPAHVAGPSVAPKPRPSPRFRTGAAPSRVIWMMPTVSAGHRRKRHRLFTVRAAVRGRPRLPPLPPPPKVATLGPVAPMEASMAGSGAAGPVLVAGSVLVEVIVLDERWSEKPPLSAVQTPSEK